MNRLIILAILLVANIGVTLASRLYAQDYNELLTKPYFIDKTEFIKTFFDSESHKVLLSSPRGFGKTHNLQMLQLFVEIELDDYGVPKHPTNATACKVFENLAISKYPEIVKDHMAKHPVLFLDLEADPVLESFTREEIIRYVNAKLCEAFAKHTWLLQIPEDVLINHYGIDAAMITYIRRLYEKNLENEDEKNDNVLYKMLLDLAIILRSYYRNSVVILVDNYDSMVSNSYKPSGKGIGLYYDYINNILQSAFEAADQNIVAGGVIMSTSGLVLANIRTFLSRTEFHPFMGENSKYTKYFGFKEEEVIQLLDRYKCKDKLNEIKSYYNGYRTVYQDITVYNAFSVTQYLNNLNNKPLRVYWSNSMSDNFLLSFMNDTFISQITRLVINNGTTGFHMAECYTAENYQIFFDVCDRYRYDKTDPGILLWFFYDHGYLSHRIIQSDTLGQFLDALGAPNYETRQALDILLHCNNPQTPESPQDILSI